MPGCTRSSVLSQQPARDCPDRQRAVVQNSGLLSALCQFFSAHPQTSPRKAPLAPCLIAQVHPCPTVTSSGRTDAVRAKADIDSDIAERQQSMITVRRQPFGSPSTSILLQLKLRALDPSAQRSMAS